MSNGPVQWKQSIERPTRGWDYDGKRILGHVGYDICLWDGATGKLLHRMKGHKERIQAVQFSPDGNHALSSSWMPPGPMLPMLKSKDTSTILWNLATGRERHNFKGEVAGEFSPDGTRIVTFSQRPGKLDTTYEFTNPETGEVRQQKATVSVIRFDNAVVWDTNTGHQLVKAKLDEYSGPRGDTLHFSPDGRRFVHVVNGAFLLYNSSGGVVFNTSDGREIGRVTRDAVKFGGGHRYTSNGALASFEPRKARLIDLKSGRVIQSIQHDLKGIWGTAWTHDGSRFAAIPYGGGEITMGDIESGKITTGAKTHPVTAGRAIISPDNSRLAIAWGGWYVDNKEVDPEFGLYDMNTGAEIAVIQLAKYGHLVGFSPDSKTLLVGGPEYDEYTSENEKRTILPEFVIYNAENGKKIRTLKLLGEVSSRE
jgi:WD40 repeat protein